MDAFDIVAWTIGGIGLCQAVLLLFHAAEHRRFHRSRLQSKLPTFANPLRVTLFVPCKGLDLNLESNLRALFEQEYPRYELCFAVERATDAACEVIQRLRAEYPNVPCRIVYSGTAANCGQKVHNLMQAVRAVPFETGVLAFVDSDACPHPRWLSRLVCRFEHTNRVVVTGYRWYMPVRNTWPNLLLSAINNLVVAIMGTHGLNLVWGGAWAIRADDFRSLGLPDAWSGTLSDDLVVSRLVRQAGMKVIYDPHCLVRSPADFSALGLAEFIRRQYTVAKVYARGWWLGALMATLVTNLLWWGAIGLTAVKFAEGGTWRVPGAIALFYYLLTSLRFGIAMRAVKPFIRVDPALYDRVARCSIWGWPVVGLANCLGLLSSGVGRTIVWRGIQYRLLSASQTAISIPSVDEAAISLHGGEDAQRAAA
jgi:ceramide glucosyltransferase